MFRLSPHLINILRENNIHTLNDARIGFPQPRGRLGWKNAAILGLPAELSEEWNSYVRLLCENFISLDEDSDDSLSWSLNPKNGCYTVKLGYKAWMENRLANPPQ
jgi:hypothetical protein